MPVRKDRFDLWLEENVCEEEGGRIHLHRLNGAIENNMKVTAPGAAVIELKLKNIGFELTKNQERQRDKWCSCKRSDRFVRNAKFKDEV